MAAESVSGAFNNDDGACFLRESKKLNIFCGRLGSLYEFAILDSLV